MTAQGRQSPSSEYRIGPGASSLLMIFVALCMTTVGILTLVSALNDTKLTQRSQQHINAYYLAAARAQQELGVIDGELSDNRVFSEDLDEYKMSIYQMRDSSVDLDVRPGDSADTLHVSFVIPMYDSHEVFVLLEVPISFTGPRYRILSHVMRDNADWQPSEKMDLFTEFD